MCDTVNWLGLTQSCTQCNRMFIILAILALSLLLAKPTAHSLSVYMVGGCGYPMFSSVRRTSHASMQFVYTAAYSASVVEATMRGVS